jgi:nitroreductase
MDSVNTGCVMENMALAAIGQGIGSVFCGILRDNKELGIKNGI